MRTTLDIDESVLAAVKELARREGRSPGAVASDLIRRALLQPVDPSAPESPSGHGFRPFGPATGDQLVTSDQVNRLRDELAV